MSTPRAAGEGTLLRPAALFWVALTAALWLLAIYLASHRSDEPVFFGRYSSAYVAMLGGLALVAIAMTMMILPGLRARSANLRANLLLAAASTLVMTGAAEVAVRVLDPIGISYYEHSRRYQLDRLPDATRGFRHRPGLIATYGATSTHFNELGLRDDPIAPKTAGEYRVLAVGDSMTFGWGVPQEEGFTEQLQRELSRGLGRPASVINAGVGGYNSVQELAFLREDGLRLAPDLILLVYVSNDVEPFTGPYESQRQLELSGRPPAEVFRLLLGRLWLYRLAAHLALYGGSKRQALAATVPVPQRDWGESLVALREMAALSRNAGVPLLVVFFRWRDAGVPAVRALMDEVRAAVAPAPVLDAAQWFAGHELRRLMNSPVDSHPNREGNRLLAGGVAAHLLSRGAAGSRLVP